MEYMKVLELQKKYDLSKPDEKLQYELTSSMSFMFITLFAIILISYIIN